MQKDILHEQHITKRSIFRIASSPAHTQRGFTLLIAALVASVVLALGTSIYELAQRQISLSSFGRDSQFAFYAADTIAECALYWDFRNSYFATTTPAGIDPKCDTKAIAPFTVSPSQNQPYSYPYTMTSAQISLFINADGVTPNQDDLGYCAEAIVTKTLDATTQAVRTVIHANGYNVSCATLTANPTTVSQQVLQRSVELHY